MNAHLIDGYEAYTDIVKAFRHAHRGAITNCYLMREELETAIREGRLFLIEEDACLFILLEQEDYFAFYFYANPSAQAHSRLPRRDKPFVANLLFRTAGPQRPNGDSLLEAAGFRHCATHRRMQKTPSSEVHSAPAAFCVRSTRQRTDDLIALWRSTIDPLSTAIPSKQMTLPPNEEILRIDEQDGRLLSAIKVAYSGSTALLEHLSTRADQRGRGLGKCLFQAVDQRALEKGVQTIRLWVDERNHAINLYRHLGFQEDGMVSRQYIAP